MVPGDVLAAVPAAREAAEAEGRRLRCDFFDDEAVLKMLRLRHIDEMQLHYAGKRLAYPTAIILFGLFAYWGPTSSTGNPPGTRISTTRRPVSSSPPSWCSSSER
ncbi:hypothetical protein ABZ953_33705 [Streptomyces sp. NPDC046465]|uniref:hypothetical protein n=1 Tax=Streptomyces sp. NPDC046465 TaxID=3155810 RepID=UPI0033F16A9D